MANLIDSRRLRRLLVLALAFSVIGGVASRRASAAPPPVTAWYFVECNQDDVPGDAYAHGQAFSQNHPGGTRLMMLDFGGARVVGTGFGTRTLCPSPHPAVFLTNTQILTALEKAADGVHNAYTGTGSTIVAYGDSNSAMSDSGMSSTDAFNAGYYQSEKAEDLAGYQSDHGYNKQSVAVGQDQEPGFDLAPISRSLADGVGNQGYALNFDFGSADGCPATGGDGSCNNGWTVSDVAYVSYDEVDVPLPEIYVEASVPEWTNIRKFWGAGYEFWGTTGEVPTQPDDLSPQTGWTHLNNQNPGLVMTELICFGC